MTAREMMNLIDHTGWMQVEAFEIEVQIKDARLRFGSVDVLVAPVNGRGEKWTPLERVALIGACV